MKLIQKTTVQFFILFVLVFVTYYPIITSHHKTDPDAKNILTILEEAGGISGYVEKIKTLNNLDVQPLRDLSLSIDLFFLNHTHTNTFIFQNLIWWILSCLVIFKLLEAIFPELSPEKRFLIVLSFSVYPLFSNTIAWGMARKHLLSFFFILISTWRLISAKESLSRKDQIMICLGYFFAMISQPISILWPFWAMAYVYYLRPELKKSFIPVCLVLMAVGLLIFLANNYYYTHSQFFLERYPSKKGQPFNFGGKILATGHYISNLILPYFPSFQYTLGHWTTLAGLILIAPIALIIKNKCHNKHTYVWLFLCVFPLIPMMTLPEMVQDTYLLLPAFGALVLVIRYFQQFSSSYFKILFLLIPLWMGFSFVQGQAWLSKSSLMKMSFKNAPNCLTAMNSVRVDLLDLKPANYEAIDYYLDHECVNPSVMSEHNMSDAYYLNALILLFDKRLDTEKRISTLKVGAEKKNLFALSALIALLIQEKRNSEIPNYMGTLLETYQEFSQPTYESIAAKIIFPYCVRNQQQDCVEALRRHVNPATDKYSY